MLRFVNCRPIVVLAACVALAGCGKSATKEAKPAGPKYIVVSAADCADNTGLDYEKCLTLIEGAIKEHDRSASIYTKLTECEKAEGSDRCDRIREKAYRARLTAFQITMTDNPSAAPLYFNKDDKPGFRSASIGDISPDADSFTFTKRASDAAHLHAKKS